MVTLEASRKKPNSAREAVHLRHGVVSLPLRLPKLRQGVLNAYYLDRFGGVDVPADVQVEVVVLNLLYARHVGEALHVLKGSVSLDYPIDMLSVDEVAGPCPADNIPAGRHPRIAPYPGARQAWPC